jgi:hypothetical protein
MCVVTMMVATLATAAPPRPLHGEWAGAQMRVVIDDAGGRIDAACAGGRFVGPVLASDDGHFTAQGSFEVHTPGPQRADASLAAVAASFAGAIHEGVLVLSIMPAGASEPQVHTLRAGVHTKLIRCF